MIDCFFLSEATERCSKRPKEPPNVSSAHGPLSAFRLPTIPCYATASSAPWVTANLNSAVYTRSGTLDMPTFPPSRRVYRCPLGRRNFRESSYHAQNRDMMPFAKHIFKNTTHKSNTIYAIHTHSASYGTVPCAWQSRAAGPSRGNTSARSWPICPP